MDFFPRDSDVPISCSSFGLLSGGYYRFLPSALGLLSHAVDRCKFCALLLDCFPTRTVRATFSLRFGLAVLTDQDAVRKYLNDTKAGHEGDPIFSQTYFLDDHDLKQLNERGVHAFRFVQTTGHMCTWATEFSSIMRSDSVRQ